MKRIAIKYKMGHFKRNHRSGWNYRGYCVVEKNKNQAGVRWMMADKLGEEWVWFFRTLAEFRNTVDCWERQRVKTEAINSTL